MNKAWQPVLAFARRQTGSGLLSNEDGNLSGPNWIEHPKFLEARFSALTFGKVASPNYLCWRRPGSSDPTPRRRTRCQKPFGLTCWTGWWTSRSGFRVFGCQIFGGEDRRASDAFDGLLVMFALLSMLELLGRWQSLFKHGYCI